MRMKRAMAAHIEDVRHTMFRQAFNAVKSKLEQMCDGSEAMMQALVRDLYMKAKRDYLSVLVQGDLPDAEKKVRSLMRKDLLEADLWFAATTPTTVFGDGRTSKSPVIRPEQGGEGRNEQAPDNQVANQPDGLQGVSRQEASVIQPRPLWK